MFTICLLQGEEDPLHTVAQRKRKSLTGWCACADTFELSGWKSYPLISEPTGNCVSMHVSCEIPGVRFLHSSSPFHLFFQSSISSRTSSNISSSILLAVLLEGNSRLEHTVSINKILKCLKCQMLVVVYANHM